MNKKSMLGILLALVAIAGIAVFQFLGDSDMLKEVKLPDAITVKGYVGGRKNGVSGQ